MIKTLHICNYALITELDIDFQPGFNIITGETGAGKSIMLGALSLLLGARADIKAVRDTNRKSVIEAVFSLESASPVPAILAANDIDDFNGQCILRRELSAEGRSRAFINDTPVTIALLRQVAMLLVDIHSQHQNLLIADKTYQLSIIDNLAGNIDLRNKYKLAYDEYKNVLKQYTETRELIRRNQADLEYISFQLEQLNDMNIQPHEQENLEQERELLANVSVIKRHIDGAVLPLSDSDNDALSQIMEAIGNCRQLCDVMPDAQSLLERLESARIEIQDITDSLREYGTDLQADPARLDEVESRLSSLYSLEMKHHVDNSDDLIALRDQLAQQLHALENSDDVLADLERKARHAKRNALQLATELSETRRIQASEFSTELRQKAMPLGMNNLRCEISLSQGKLNADGIDTIDFLFAFNKNQQLMPVGATASGGEISRLMLAIKSIVAEKMSLPSIIFDEVDTGVSGDVANRMAQMMADIAKRIQVITITHLPQVAARGNAHFKVYKEDDENSTMTRIRILGKEERIAELALMLSGRTDDETSLAAARSLIAKS
jgi:DNA repair protein RecN (Recombination protein N)